MSAPFTLHPERPLAENLADLGVAHSRATGRGSSGKRDLICDGVALGAFTVSQIWAALHLHAKGVDFVEALAEARTKS